MAKFTLKKAESKEVAKATFKNKEDFKVVVLSNDPLKTPRVLHVIQADRLIKAKKAEEVKDAQLEVKNFLRNVTPTGEKIQTKK